MAFEPTLGNKDTKVSKFKDWARTETIRSSLVSIVAGFSILQVLQSICLLSSSLVRARISENDKGLLFLFLIIEDWE